MNGNSGNMTHRALLERVAALGLSDRAVERAAELPQAFMSKARAGRCDGPRADESWTALAAWLGARARKPVKRGRPPRREAAEQTVRGQPAEQRLCDLIRAADTREKCRELIDELLVHLATGDIESAKGRVLIEALREKRQWLEDIDEERRRIDVHKPVTVKVVWASDWREKVAANEAAEAAEAELAQEGP